MRHKIRLFFISLKYSPKIWLKSLKKLISRESKIKQLKRDLRIYKTTGHNFIEQIEDLEATIENPWISTDYALPKEYSLVVVAYRHYSRGGTWAEASHSLCEYHPDEGFYELTTGKHFDERSFVVTHYYHAAVLPKEYQSLSNEEYRNHYPQLTQKLVP